MRVLLADYMVNTSIEDIVSLLATAALLDSSAAALTKCTKMTLSIKVSNELEVSKNFSGLSVGSDNHNISLLLSDTKKMVDYKKYLINAKDEKKIVLNRI